MANIPVILLALANDNEHKQRKLSNLQNEATAILQGLESAIKDQLCEVFILEKTTIDDILSAFRKPKYKNRISIFHYAGHADGYKLLLETEDNKNKVARGEGLVSYLSRQDSLQLVFLNGCSTEQQAEDLITAGAPAVIGTSTSIKDTVAMELASRFYKSIGSGATLETSWLDAIDEVKISNSENELRSFGDTEDNIKIINDRYPWDLKIRNGAEQVKQWNLPDASNNPLFKLPKIDEKYYKSLPYPPFRYLKYYTQDNAATFFGRGYEIRDLYEALQQRQNSITLLHGKSGVGKSSLLNAGLIPRIEKQFTVFYARRNDNLGLAKTLSNLLTGENNGDLSTYWQQHEKQTGKPLLVILDQVEEYETKAIDSIKDELGDLFNQIQSLFKQSSTLKGQILLGYRKEFHVDIEKRLKERHLPYSSVYLEPLNRNGIMEAVQGLAKHEITKNYYNYSVEGLDDKSENDLASIISDDLLEDKNSPVASLLQIHLSNLWKKINPKDKEPAHKQATKFKVDDYQQIAKTSLDDFFNDQINLIEKVNPQVVASGLVLEILQEHTTKFGTAKSCDSYTIEANYQHCGDIKLLQQQLVDNYLLSKKSKNSTVLAHDTLGVIVLSNYANSDRPAQRTRRILSNKTTTIEAERKIENILDEHDFTEVEAGLNSIKKLSKRERRLLEKSWEAREQREKARKRRKRLGISAVTTIAGVAVVATIFYFKADTERKRAENEIVQARSLIDFMVINIKNKLDTVGRIDIMEDIAKEVDDYYNNSSDKNSLNSDKRKVANLRNKASNYVLKGDIDNALNTYIKVINDTDILQKKLPNEINLYINLASDYRSVGYIYSYTFRNNKAVESFNKSLNITKEILSKDTNNIIYRQEVALSYMSLGDYSMKIIDYKMALKYYNMALSYMNKIKYDSIDGIHIKSIIYQQIGDLYSDIFYNIEEGIDKELLSNINKNLLNMGGKVKFYDEVSSILESKIVNEFSDKKKYILSIKKELCRESSCVNTALENLNRSASLLESIFEKDPSNINYYKDLGITYKKLSNVYLNNGKTDKALDMIYRVLSVRNEIVRRNPKNSSARSEVIEAEMGLATIYIKMTKFSEAAKWFESIIPKLEYEIEIDPNNKKNKEALNMTRKMYNLLIFSKSFMPSDDSSRNK